MKKTLLLGLLLAGNLIGSALATTVAEVKKKGTLVLGTDPQFQPFEFTNEKGEIVGFDIDIARAIAKDLGVKLEIQNVGFGQLMPGSVTSKRVDLAISGITITDERAKVVSFSKPYFTSAQVFIARNGNPKKLDWPLNSLKGRTIGVQSNTTGFYFADENLKKLGATLKVYDDFASGLSDVQNGRIDAIVGDKPTVDYLKKARAGQFVQAGKDLVSEDYGIAFARNSDLVQAANKTLDRLKKSGEYQKLIEKWIVAK